MEAPRETLQRALRRERVTLQPTKHSSGGGAPPRPASKQAPPEPVADVLPPIWQNCPENEPERSHCAARSPGESVAQAGRGSNRELRLRGKSAPAAPAASVPRSTDRREQSGPCESSAHPRHRRSQTPGDLERSGPCPPSADRTQSSPDLPPTFAGYNAD